MVINFGNTDGRRTDGHTEGQTDVEVEIVIQINTLPEPWLARGLSGYEAPSFGLNCKV